MCNERAILCGTVRDDALPVADRNPLRFRAWGPHKNIRLEILDVSEALYSDVPVHFRDLIDIAVYVYCADQAVKRGDDTFRAFGTHWRRRLFFRVAVRDPDFWADPRACNQLKATLSFLSEDEYEFEFVRLLRDEPFQGCFDLVADPYAGRIDEVVLFSGGLDSLAGAVQEAILDRKNVALVHHRSSEKMVTRHRELVRLLTRRAGTTPPAHFPVRINKSQRYNAEFTQRTRSFLYAALGATVAAMLRLSRVRFYENGVVSLNLPPSAQVVGARATRTTHPQVLNGFSDLLTCVAGKLFTVENRFRWKTKADIVRLIAEAGCHELIGHTTSCTHTWVMTHEHPHCGICSQCIDRRFAVLAAGQAAHDPGDRYGVDLLVGERPEGQPRTMLAAYLEMANEIDRMSLLQFFGRFGEAGRVLRHVGGSAEAAAQQVFDLYRSHAQAVTRVVVEGLASHATAVWRRELPAGCLLRMVFDCGLPSDGQTGAATAPPGSRQDTLADNVFRRSGRAWEVRFAGGRPFTLLPTKGAAYLQILLSHPNQPFSVLDLLCQVSKNRVRFALEHGTEAADRESLRAYQGRLQELRAELEKVRADSDEAAEGRIQEEIEGLLKELRSVSGLGGRVRRLQDQREQARQSVGAAIRRALQNIAADGDSRLAEHLKFPRLRCGFNLCYAPDQPVSWDPGP
jgi:7-cyano-7-deazaguanine synthase in queuosine biosynthesis